MVTRTTTFGGALLVMLGLLGFAAPGFMGLHLNVVHNLALLFSGALAIYFGLKARLEAARAFCIVCGGLYGLLGLAGFVAGGPDYSFTIIPGTLVLGTSDHLIHLMFGAVFLSVGLGWRPAIPTPKTR
ncbi:MAG TPA: DUF4383 domain-containing protein [Candidatus Binatia bacterium]|nr:DUF4383 domain-containing protein [Candidatus Binatia bacterium]